MTGRAVKDIIVDGIVVVFKGQIVKILSVSNSSCEIESKGREVVTSTSEIEILDHREILDQSYELQGQIETIRKWGEGTVSIVLALFEKNLSEDKLESKCEEVTDLIRSRVLGNHGKILVSDDATLKQMYRRMVEATLRWAIEKVLE
jgi:hypothetical protein